MIKKLFFILWTIGDGFLVLLEAFIDIFIRTVRKILNEK